ncbi:MAG: metallophosphoesterase [Planctomycetia bacterium]|nr:metallophosphoesterase [Planctomycetia bacterium]
MNRRDFLKSVAAWTMVGAWGEVSTAWAEQDVPQSADRVAIFSDTHLHGPEDIQHVVRFNQCVAKVLAMNPRPATLLIYGDVAYLEGKVEEYVLFRKLIQPIEKAGIHWECAMGNHDRIANFRSVFPERFTETPILENRYIHIVKTPRADFILLDSYLKDHVDGQIEPAQKAWLAETLKNYDKTVFVGCHHPLVETKLADVLRACPKFAAYLYGHNHHWRCAVEEKIQTVCFPSTGHWGDMGFAMLTLSDGKALFEPDIDAYLFPNWSKNRTPVKDVEEYLRRLNARTLEIRI